MRLFQEVQKIQEETIYNLTFLTQLFSFSLHSLLILSLCTCIFCSCTHSLYILCSDYELAQHRHFLGAATVLITIIRKGFIMIHGWDMYCLGKVTKKGREHGHRYSIYRYLPAKNFRVQFKRKNQLNTAKK